MKRVEPAPMCKLADVFCESDPGGGFLVQVTSEMILLSKAPPNKPLNLAKFGHECHCLSLSPLRFLFLWFENAAGPLDFWAF